MSAMVVGGAVGNRSPTSNQWADDSGNDVSNETGSEDGLDDYAEGRRHGAAESVRDDRPLVLPMGRIKKIIKQEPGVKAVAADANFIIGKAAELFIRVLASKTSEHMAASGRFQVAYSDVAASVAALPSCIFLQARRGLRIAAAGQGWGSRPVTEGMRPVASACSHPSAALGFSQCCKGDAPPNIECFTPSGVCLMADIVPRKTTTRKLLKSQSQSQLAKATPGGTKRQEKSECPAAAAWAEGGKPPKTPRSDLRPAIAPRPF